MNKPDPESYCHAISDQTRRRILALLCSHGELCVCELTGALQLSQPKISRHLAVLRDSGLVASRREGTWVHYHCNPQMPAWTGHSLEALMQGCEGNAPYRQDLTRLQRQTAGACG